MDTNIVTFLIVVVAWYRNSLEDKLRYRTKNLLVLIYGLLSLGDGHAAAHRDHCLHFVIFSIHFGPISFLSRIQARLPCGVETNTQTSTRPDHAGIDSS